MPITSHHPRQRRAGLHSCTEGHLDSARRDGQAKDLLMEQIIGELRIQAAIEERLVHPETRDQADQFRDDETVHLLAEVRDGRRSALHAIMADLDRLTIDSMPRTRREHVLHGLVEHDVASIEERDLFAAAHKLVSGLNLSALGERV